MITELNVMKRLKPHPHVLKLIGCCSISGKSGPTIRKIIRVCIIIIIIIIIAPAGFRPRDRNPRRHPNVPRVKKKCRIVIVLVCEHFLDLMKLGAHGGSG